MKTTDFIHLDDSVTKEVSDELQKLLADLQIFYTNLRGFHWNIKGRLFFLLHEKFEHMYDSTAVKIDEVAERILMLGHTPAHNFSEYLKVSEIKESQVVKNGEDAVKLILEYLSIILKKEREIISIASDVEDEGTVALLSGFISEQEKTVWMLASYLS